MKKILSLSLIITFYIFTISCFRTDGQQKDAGTPVTNESVQNQTGQDQRVQEEQTVLEQSAPNQSTQNQTTQDKPIALKKGQDRIKELTEELGLQSIRPVAMVDFELADLAGQLHKFSSYKGKIIFLNFWATWCPPCKSEMPDMQKLYEAFKNKNFQMLAINLTEPKAEVASFMQKKGFNFPVLLDSRGKAGATYGAASIPLTILVNKKGTLIYGAMGARPWASPEAIELIQLLIDQPE